MDMLQVYMWIPMPSRDLASPAPQMVWRPWNTQKNTVSVSAQGIFYKCVYEQKRKQAALTATKSTFLSVDLGMVNGSHRSCGGVRIEYFTVSCCLKSFDKYYNSSCWHTWLGSGSTSFQLSVRSPHGTGIKGLCLTDGMIRYNQLQKLEGTQFSYSQCIWFILSMRGD